MRNIKLPNLKYRIIILFTIFLYGFSANASETVTERAILNSIKEFSYTQMPLSFGKLWVAETDNNTPYNVWQSIKSSGERHDVNWSGISFYDSYQETILRNGKSYKCGVVILKLNVNKGDYLALGIFYLADSNGRIVNMRDNWSRELSGVPARAKDSLKQLVDRWL